MNQLARLDQYRVFVIDNQIITLGLRTLFGGMLKEVKICGSMNTYQTAYDFIGKLPSLPDLVIADINLGFGVSLEGVKQLLALYPDLRILVFTMEQEKIFALRALKAGAIGYVHKTAAHDYLAGAIKTALSGGTAVSPKINDYIMQNLMGRLAGQKPTGLDALSDREMEVLKMLGGGMSTREISKRLGLSIKTVETHRAHIKEKLGLRNAGELQQYAFSVVQGG